MKGDIYEQIVDTIADVSFMYNEIADEIRVPVTYDYSGTGRIVNIAKSDISETAIGNINMVAGGNITETAVDDITEIAVNLTRHGGDITDMVDSGGIIDHKDA